MSTLLTCPDREQYQQLLAGVYPAADQFARLVEHLESCARCADTVHDLQGSDTLVKIAVISDRPQAEEEAVEQLMDRISRLAPPQMPAATLRTKSGAEAAEDISKILTPPRGPGEIGWLDAYRVLRVLGQGGMGIVLLAEDPRLPRLVALKVMKPILAVSAEARRRFDAEARAMTIEHDHIVPIYLVGEAAGVPFLVMPFLRGESLEARLRRDGKLSLAEAIRIGREMAIGLAVAHAHGLIHRDIKPANIWLEERHENSVSAPPLPSCRVKLLDFGLVRAVALDGKQTQSRASLGTPAYMAPEQAKGEKVDARSDLFSLGCVLYRMTTGHEPFTGANAWAILRSVECDHPEPPHRLNAALPLSLSQLIERLLAKNPGDRPSSASEVVQALDDLAVGVRLPAALTPVAVVPSRAIRRRWFLTMAALAASIGLLIAGTFMMLRSVPPDDQNKESAQSSVPLLLGGVVSDAPALPGVARWTLETVAPRGRISAIAFRPGTHEVATCSADGVIRLWDAANGRLLRAIVLALPDGSDVRNTSLAWKPDGKALTWGLPSGNVYRIDPDTGRATPWHQNVGPIASLAWSADGKKFAVGLGGTASEIRVWDCGELLPPLRGANVSSLAFSPDGKLLAAGGSQIWDVEASKLSPLSKTLPEKAKVPPTALAWSPDGAQLAIGGLLWSKAGGKTRTLEKEAVAAVRWLDDGKQIALAKNSGWVSVIDLATGRPRRGVVLQGLAAAISGPAALSWDAAFLAGNPYGEGTFKLWDAVSGVSAHEFVGLDRNMPWRASPDGRRLIAAIDRATLTLYETATGKLLQVVRPDRGVALDGGFSPDGKWLAAGGWVRQADTLKEVHSVRGLWAAAWSPKSDRLAYIIQRQKGIRILDLASKKSHLVLADAPTTSGLAWSPDGKKMAVALGGRGAAIYDLERGVKLASIEPLGHTMTEVAWSPDGKLLAVVGERHGWACDALTGKVIEELAKKDKIAMSLAFSPDSKLLAGTISDGGVCLWGTKSWTERRLAVPPFDGSLMLPHWTEDGKTLFVGGSVGEIHVFDVANGHRRSVLWPLSNSRCVVVGSHGHYSGTRGVERAIVYVVQTNQGQETLTPEEFAKRFGWKNDPDKVGLLAK